MKMSKNKTVVGILDDQTQAENVVASLQSAGFAGNDISVLFPDKRGTKDFAHEHNTKAPEGAVAGVAGGGVVGGTIGLLAGIGALAIPGLGPFIAAGPLMAALSGAAAGAAIGGIAGALIGMGIPEIEAKRYEGKVRGGNLLVAVHVDSGDEQKRATEILKRAGAHDVTATTEASVPKAKPSETRP
ncbi:MAG TPA: general stress protein [Polyangiaceae bacterium]|nr:general stress protein [Polyangiaceae bacterium]